MNITFLDCRCLSSIYNKCVVFPALMLSRLGALYPTQQARNLNCCPYTYTGFVVLTVLTPAADNNSILNSFLR